MKENTRSLIRHILTALGTILTLIGLNSVVPVVDFLMENLDSVSNAVEVIIGFLLAAYGFFKDGNRHEARVNPK